jgi:hypothetical protein
MSIQNSENKVKQNQDKVNKIINILADMYMPAQLEVLGNVFIRLGFSILGDDIPAPTGPLTLMDTLAEYRAKYGESIGTALIQQGMVLLMWIDNIIKDEEKQ